MKIYLDTCSLQRPLDDKTQLRIRLEAEAILSVLDVIRAGRLALVSSEALDFEISRNPHRMRQEYALEALADADLYVSLSNEVETRAKELNKAGVGPLDSLHLASAENGEVDLFCTCDDSFLIKAKREIRGKTKVVSPIELAEEVDKWQSRQNP